MASGHSPMAACRWGAACGAAAERAHEHHAETRARWEATLSDAFGSLFGGAPAAAPQQQQQQQQPSPEAGLRASYVAMDWSHTRNAFRHICTLEPIAGSAGRHELYGGLPARLQFTRSGRSALSEPPRATVDVAFRCTGDPRDLAKWAEARLGRHAIDSDQVSVAKLPDGGRLFALRLRSDGVTLLCKRTPAPAAAAKAPSRSPSPSKSPQQQQQQQQAEQQAAARSSLLARFGAAGATPWELACDSAAQVAQAHHTAVQDKWGATVHLATVQQEVNSMVEDAELFLSCMRFSTREQLREVEASLRGGGSILATGGGTISSRSLGGGSAVLVDLIPKLRKAQPRAAALLADPTVVDRAIRLKLEKLKSVLDQALRKYDKLAAESRPALPAPDAQLARFSLPEPPPSRFSQWTRQLLGRKALPPRPRQLRHARGAGSPTKQLREELIFDKHSPVFCVFALVVCCVVFLVEIAENEWRVQPFTCPSVGETGLPAYEDGTACESNLMLGPAMVVLDRLGAKNDVAIFEHGEWWRLFTCNWLHSGLFHLLLNMAAVLALGMPLERTFGLARTALLYIVSGLVGTTASAVFLPGVISVGASASVFGLVGAYWADVILNYCAACTLRGAGLTGLFVATVPNVLLGLTPWIDNFMHLFGMLSGGAIACLLLPEVRARARVVTADSHLGGARAPLVKASPLGRKRRSQVEHWQRLGDRVIGEGAAMARAVDGAMRHAQEERQRGIGGRIAAKLSKLSKVGESGGGGDDRDGGGISPVPWDAAALNTPALASAASASGASASSTNADAAARPAGGSRPGGARGPLRRLGYARLWAKLTWAQKVVVGAASLVLLACIVFSFAAASSDVQDLLRSCEACTAFNCVELGGWWSCCVASIAGSCVLEMGDTELLGVCNLTGMPLFNVSCNLDDPACAWDYSPKSTSDMCRHLCFDC